MACGATGELHIEGREVKHHQESRKPGYLGIPAAPDPPFPPEMWKVDTKKAWNHAGGRLERAATGQDHNQGTEPRPKSNGDWMLKFSLFFAPLALTSRYPRFRTLKREKGRQWPHRDKDEMCPPNTSYSLSATY